ncbi:hypothetical protein [Planktothrix pseudagardhii]|uniref:Uncharacterized protein n=1 Tax=Planktothrix pseudagardhii TaxID=132604 RepID=A0A9W4GBV4_9CYAN|nr:hypothetical protein [Planktothrix pseudagardhii]CAD5988660.1 hypothetical protein NO713_05758 [Planktothrix pseudagardhii]
MKLGEILLKRKLISQHQLEVTLFQQRTDSKRIGELLLEKGCISEKDLTTALKEQQWRHQGFWVIN